MRYTVKELRLFDLFALVLAGLGLLFLTVGVAGLAAAGPGTVVVSGRHGKPGKGGAKVAAATSRGWAPLLTGTAFLALGIALGTGVRRVARNDGEDVADFPGVPTAGSEGTDR